MQAKIVHVVNLIAEKGTHLREPYSKHLEDGIFELRAKVGSDISRVLYFFVVGRKIVLTNGFVKKTQQTPPNEIERAKAYRTDYMNRKEMEQYD
ncbi:MAG: type II toxin-antitoxin system RelE/ParE family toxin [Schwartzia sp.]|nr:type II toxin-antitoxin system RelE/ParE family toxin [Schwartzia sp. (in: firmicutes)]